MLKRILSLLLVMLVVLSLCACGGNTAPAESTAEPTVEPTTMDWTKKDSLKVLTLGHSLTVDSCHMLALIAAAEGYEDLTVGTLYYSGTPLYRHVEFLTNDTPAYAL